MAGDNNPISPEYLRQYAPNLLYESCPVPCKRYPVIFIIVAKWRWLGTYHTVSNQHYTPRLGSLHLGFLARQGQSNMSPHLLKMPLPHFEVYFKKMTSVASSKSWVSTYIKSLQYKMTIAQLYYYLKNQMIKRTPYKYLEPFPAQRLQEHAHPIHNCLFWKFPREPRVAVVRLGWNMSL